MQKENPVIKNYILSSKKRILTDEDTPLRSNRKTTFNFQFSTFNLRKPTVMRKVFLVTFLIVRITRSPTIEAELVMIK